MGDLSGKKSRKEAILRLVKKGERRKRKRVFLLDTGGREKRETRKKKEKKGKKGRKRETKVLVLLSLEESFFLFFVRKREEAL